MNEPDRLLELTNVFKRYDSPDGAETLDVLKGITLQVAVGESLAVVVGLGLGKKHPA